MRIVKNGDYTEADAVASEVDHKTGTGTDIVSTAIHYDTMMSTNDYLEVWVRNETSATTVTLNHMYLFALGMIT